MVLVFRRGSINHLRALPQACNDDLADSDPWVQPHRERRIIDELKGNRLVTSRTDKVLCALNFDTEPSKGASTGDERADFRREFDVLFSPRKCDGSWPDHDSSVGVGSYRSVPLHDTFITFPSDIERAPQNPQPARSED